MKRRTFVWNTFMGAVAFYLPTFSWGNQKVQLHQTLAQPLFLSSCCDGKTIKAIGKNYQKQLSLKEEQLMQLLLTDHTGKSRTSGNDPEKIINYLQQKVQKDFEMGRTVMVDGWILSTTEAQQCALFSLLSHENECFYAY